MKKKQIMLNVNTKLRALRAENHLGITEMAKQLGIEKSCYSRYESGERLARIDILCNVGLRFGISMDWLVLDRGKKYFDAPEDSPKPDMVEVRDTDTCELLKDMEEDPRLRHEVLLHYYKYKEKYKEE